MKALHIFRRKQALGHAGAGIGLEDLPGRRHGRIKQSLGFGGLILFQGDETHAQAPQVFILSGGLSDESFAFHHKVIGILSSRRDVRRLTGGHPQHQQQQAGRGKLHDAVGSSPSDRLRRPGPVF